MNAARVISGAVLMAGVAIGPAAVASAGPPTDVLCERVGGGEVPTDFLFGSWGCELTNAPAGGEERLIDVADRSKACPRENLFEFEFDLGGGMRRFLICFGA